MRTKNVGISTYVYAYNISKHESSKYCPFTVMFGRQAILPVEVSSSKKEDAIANTTGEEDKDRIIDDHLSYQSKVAEKVKENIRAAQARQKEAYRIRKKFRSGKVSYISKMAIHLQKFSSKTIYVQDMSFVAKGFTTKLFLQIFLNLVIYETFPIRNFFVYGMTKSGTIPRHSKLVHWF